MLFDLGVVSQANRAHDCAGAAASVDLLWPPDGRMVAIDIAGITDPDGDGIVCRITQIMRDEPGGDGSSARRGADARVIGSATAELRAERNGSGNGRVYTIFYSASDGRGGVCEGPLKVCVPHGMGRGRACVDDGELYDATLADENTLDADNYPNQEINLMLAAAIPEFGSSVGLIMTVASVMIAMVVFVVPRRRR